MAVDTFFAPPERISQEEIMDRVETLVSWDHIDSFLDTISELVFIINKERQIVYANKAVRDLADNPDDVYGKRHGELLQCIHSREMESGCGTAPSCAHCVGVQAVIETQRTGKPVSREYTVKAHTDAGGINYHFLITTTPFSLREEELVMVNLKDVSAEKRKNALERIFFHDLLNTVSSMKVHLELVKRLSKDSGDYLKSLENITDSLAEEIKSQRMLVYAEKKELTVQRDLIHSTDLAEEVIELFAHSELARNKKLILRPFSEALSFVSDSSILRRCLVNGVKNALEASPEGAEITLGIEMKTGRAIFSIHNPVYIKPEIQPHIFNRYFSTKGENRGLGTYSMKLLTEEYLGGKVFFNSTPDDGTTFFISLPTSVK